MLVEYRKDYEKIAVGLLSFIRELHQYNRSRSELEWALQSKYQVFLWKDSEQNHLIGIVILQIDSAAVLVRRISFTPSERTGKKIFDCLTAVANRYPQKRLMGTLETQPLISSWERDHFA